MRPIIRHLTLSLALCTTWTNAFCPNGCSCNNEPPDQISADCSRADLSSIPMFLNPRLKSLNLHGNQLSSLTMDELSFYPELRQLDLSSNQIRSIDRGAFASLSKLKELSLSQNLLHSLDPDTFKGLVSLSVLDLSDNTIARLPTSVFVELAALRELNVSYNDIGDVSPGAFTGLGALRQLHIQHNKLSMLPSVALRSVSALEHLNVASNALQVVHNESMECLQQMHQLDLSHNQIDAIETSAFVGLHNLRILKLQRNTLYKVPSSALHVLTELTELDLSDNELDELDTSCFDGLANLDTLIVTQCDALKHVHMMAFSGLFKLRTLHLHSNMQLSALHAQAFEQPTQLRHLSLANNNLQHVPHGLLNWSQIVDLDLRGNPWMCDCELMWMSGEQTRHLQETPGMQQALCAMPLELRDHRVSDLSSGVLSCGSLVPDSWLHLLLFALTLSSVAVLLVILCRFHDRLCCGSRNHKCPPECSVDSERASCSSQLYMGAAILPNQDAHCSPFYSGGSINPKLAALQHGNQHLLYANFAPAPHGTLGAQFYSSSGYMPAQGVYTTTTDGSTGSSSGYMTSNSVLRNHSPPMPQAYDTNAHVYSAIAPLGDSPRSLRSDAALLGRQGYTLVNTVDA